MVITASRFRTQERNRTDALERLTTLLARATERPTPRRRTKPSKTAKANRLESKTRRGAIKKLRGKLSGED